MEETEPSAEVKEGEAAIAANEANNLEEKPTKYAWAVLWTIFAVRAIHQLHRQIIGYAYGYQGLGDKFSPFYMISLAYP